MRPPFPSELGLTEFEKYILDMCTGGGLDPFNIWHTIEGRECLQSVISAATSLVNRNLIEVRGGPDFLATSTMDNRTATATLLDESLWTTQHQRRVTVHNTLEGDGINSALLLKGDRVVYFYRVEQSGVDINVLPVVATVETLVPDNGSLVPLRFYTPEFTQDGLLFAVHMTSGSVAPELLMRLTDFCDGNPVVFGDDAKFSFEHSLGQVLRHPER